MAVVAAFEGLIVSRDPAWGIEHNTYEIGSQMDVWSGGYSFTPLLELPLYQLV